MGMCSALGMYAPEVQASNGEANSLIATSVQQTKKVTGNISDSMGPLIGATIKEKGTGNGVVTDLDGNFSINVKPGATLVISYVGYNTKEIVVGNQTNIKVSMEEEGHSLNDVVVIGYGTQRKEAITGSVANVGGGQVEPNCFIKCRTSPPRSCCRCIDDPNLLTTWRRDANSHPWPALIDSQ